MRNFHAKDHTTNDVHRLFILPRAEEVHLIRLELVPVSAKKTLTQGSSQMINPFAPNFNVGAQIPVPSANVCEINAHFCCGRFPSVLATLNLGGQGDVNHILRNFEMSVFFADTGISIYIRMLSKIST